MNSMDSETNYTADSLKKDKKKGYEELLKGAVTDKGMFDVTAREPTSCSRFPTR